MRSFSDNPPSAAREQRVADFATPTNPSAKSQILTASDKGSSAAIKRVSRKKMAECGYTRSRGYYHHGNSASAELYSAYSGFAPERRLASSIMGRRSFAEDRCYIARIGSIDLIPLDSSRSDSINLRTTQKIAIPSSDLSRSSQARVLESSIVNRSLDLSNWRISFAPSSTRSVGFDVKYVSSAVTTCSRPVLFEVSYVLFTEATRGNSEITPRVTCSCSHGQTLLRFTRDV